MGRFVKGQSGNPGGRAKGLGDIRALAQSHAPKAMAVLVAALTDDDPRVRVKAAEALLDRGYGKPAQSITGPDGGPVAIESITRTIVDPKA